MNLNEFLYKDTKSKFSKLKTALRENYGYAIDYKNLTLPRAKEISKKIKTRISEVKDFNSRVKYNLIAESLDLWIQSKIQSELTNFNITEDIDNESIEEAKIILAAKEISDKIQDMIEDAAKMQVQDLLPIVDAMKTEIGNDEAETFANMADEALENLLESLKNAKELYDNAIEVIQGNPVETDMDSYDLDSGDDENIEDMEVDMSAMDDDEDDVEDDFGGEEATVGDDEPSGRELKK